jgi:hypothetical protein
MHPYNTNSQAAPLYSVPELRRWRRQAAAICEKGFGGGYHRALRTEIVKKIYSYMSLTHRPRTVLLPSMLLYPHVGDK